MGFFFYILTEGIPVLWVKIIPMVPRGAKLGRVVNGSVLIRVQIRLVKEKVEPDIYLEPFRNQFLGFRTRNRTKRVMGLDPGLYPDPSLVKNDIKKT